MTMIECLCLEGNIMNNKQKLIDLFFYAENKPIEQSILLQIEKENKTDGK